ncbi:transmembrane protein 272-like isoform X2 [Sardina pilchardus]|uniref:transmembrane protein 272-like isoform X2 n=1 Tax=Sardina pilchardus TaxID=27697 RepID=UPI002E118156
MVECEAIPVAIIYIYMDISAKKESHWFSKALTIILFLLLFCWFITGQVWIYSIYPPNYNNPGYNQTTYCHKTLYRYSFSTSILIIVTFLVHLIYIAVCLRNRNRCDSQGTGIEVPV